jgi:hypothetical protein
MNMPGFTGEASLYRTSAHYYMAEAVVISRDQVVPQFPLLLNPLLIYLSGLTCHDMAELCLASCYPLPNDIGQTHKYKCLKCCTDKHKFCLDQVGTGPGGWFHFPRSPKCRLPPPYMFP